MTKAFKKGELVTRIADWDRKGTVTYRDAVVYSCGAKQMVLTDAITGKEIGRHFRPVRATGHELGTHPRLTETEAQAICLAAGAAVIEQERAVYERCISSHATDTHYVAAIRRSVADLHEPRSLRHPV